MMMMMMMILRPVRHICGTVIPDNHLQWQRKKTAKKIQQTNQP